jgi:hypothetical protein
MPKNKKNIKVRDLKPSKDAKGGGGVHFTSGTGVQGVGLHGVGLHGKGVHHRHNVER